ncbi:MAG: hypothetical protein L0Y79_07235 [Chlorobi bacterium]|nr:hypothetical protein [Chlorobiota bacterium]MCI0716852.1 hypothetical protein [Chlorobiota bacterium]
MKKTSFLLIFSLLIFNLYSQTSPDWRWIHPRPQGQNINYFKMLDANNWFAFADYGMMLKTSNAGTTWTALSIGNPSTLYPGTGILQNNLTAWFFSASSFLVGSQSTQGIAKTTNGGLTFDTIQVLTSGSGSVYDFHFINSQTGYFAARTLTSCKRLPMAD